MIRDDIDFGRHLDYIHFNPVKHGTVSKPLDWKWSSFHRYSDWVTIAKSGVAAMFVVPMKIPFGE